LIPIVSRECGLDVDDFGVILKQCNIEEISKVVQMISSFPETYYRDKSTKAYKTTLTDYSESAFHRNMSNAISYWLLSKN